MLIPLAILPSHVKPDCRGANNAVASYLSRDGHPIAWTAQAAIVALPPFLPPGACREELVAACRCHVSFFQIRGNLKARPLLRIRYGGELGEGGLEVFDNLSRDDVGVGKVCAVFEAWKARPLLHPRYGVFEPKDV